MAFGDSWLISVMMRFTSNGARIMGEMSTGAAALEGRIDKATAAMNRLNASSMRAAKGFLLAATGIGVYAIAQAGQLQRTLTAIQNETGADPRKMGLVYNNIFDIANKVGVSPNEAARSWLDISRLTAGQLSVAQMRAIAPSVMQYASMIHYNRPDVSVDEATKTGLQLVHLFRAYKPEVLVPLLDKAYRLSGLMAETPSQAVRQMTYYEPLFKGLGIDANTSIGMMGLLDRAGFRQKVGTNVRAMMLEALGPLQLTSHAQKGKLGYLEQMGVFQHGRFAWNTKDGGVNFLGMLGSIAAWEQSKRARGVPDSELAKIIYSVFGKQGGNISQLMADKQMTGILSGIRKYLANPNVSLAAGVHHRDDALGFQAGRAWGNLQGVITELAYSEVPDLTHGFKWMADSLQSARVWLQHNRGAESAIVRGFTLLTGLAAARVGLGYLGTFIRFLAGIKGLGELAGAAKAWRIIDNVLTGGLVTRMTRFGGGLRGLGGGLVNAAGGVNALATAVGRVSSILGVLLGTTSFYPQNNARRDLIDRYGYDYWRYLKGQHPGTNPYSFNPDDGDLTPQEYKSTHGEIHVHIHDHTSGGIRSKVRSQGQLHTSPSNPGVLQLEAASQGHHP